MSEDVALVLAAGQGTRMRSTLPKVLHKLAGQPMLVRVLNSLGAAGFPHPRVVVGFGAGRIREEVGDRCSYVLQAEQKGTGDAVLSGVLGLPASARRVLVVHGDEALLDPECYGAMLERQDETGALVVLLTAHVTDTRDFGRVVRDEAGRPVALVQQGDLRAEQLDLDEVNLGAYVFDARFLHENLPQLKPHLPKGELYLTDLIAIAASTASRSPGVEAVTVPDGEAVMGVNDLVQLEASGRVIYRRKNEALMRAGVTIVDSASTFVDDEAQIEPDVVIQPFSTISGPSRIRGFSKIGPGARILSSEIGRNCTVIASTIDSSTLDDEVRVGPYAHVRGGAHIGRGVEIGSHSEVKGSVLGRGTKMHHFGYLGDATIGADVNIGAGAVTCNYDGVTKHRTVIEDEVSIGSDTMLRAPVTIGRGSVTGAGSVVTRDVPAGKVAAGMPARAIKSVPKRERPDLHKSEVEGEGDG